MSYRLYRGFVLTNRGAVLVQLPDDSPQGFSLYSEDHCWPGGFGIAESWKPVTMTDLGEAEQEEASYIASRMED